MSLNGLDDAKVDAAYQAALAEAGGWFLLQYTARDEVGLLQAGTGGVVEVREAIAQYDKQSPLYGFVQYRRRKVLLKYLPAGTSRLIQARVSVHFQSIIDKFNPHDTIFTVNAPSELKETAVSSACSLHTASGSTSSSNSSLRRRRLQEITEDGEDNPPTEAKHGNTISPEGLDEQVGSTMDIKAADADQDAKAKEEEEKAIWRKEREAAKASITQPPRHYNRVPATPAPSLHEDDDGDDDSEGNDHYSNHLARMEHDRRKSSQSTRPTMRDLHGEYVYKPKVKLGPRPSLDIGGRPHTSGSSSRSKEPRPISTLPAGIRIPSKKPTPRRPQSQHSTSRSRTIPNLSQAPPIPNLPNLNQSAPAQAMPNVETAVVNPTQPQSTSKPSGMTPEKQRLMKALQLRKRQMAMAAASKETRTKSAQVSQAEPEESAPQQEREVEIIPAGLDEAKKCIDVNRVRSTAENDEDSGSTFPASSPISPSEGPSTQASSFTDENKHSANVVEEKIAKHGSHGPVGAIMMSQVTQVDQACSPTEETTEILPVEIPLPPVTKQEARSLVQAADTPLKSSPETGFQDSVDEIEPVAIYVTSNTQDGEEDFFDTRPSTAETLDQQSFEKPTKRGGLIDPIRIVSSAENSDDNYLSDDSFMEELKSATVQEAKPVSVAKSPINPMFANNLRDRRPSDVGSDSPTTSGTALNRRAAGPSHLSPNTPAHNYTRSMSAPYESVGGSQQALALMAKKINVSSGISRRIKALELVSSRATSPATPSPISAIVQNSSPPFAELRKASLRSLSSTSESVIRQENRVPNTTPYPTPISSPISPTPQEVVSRKSRPESISVTARILRDCNNVRPEVPTDPSEPIPLYLHHSPLTVKHQKATTLQTDLEHRKPEGTRLADGSLPEANDDSHTASSPSPVPTPRRSSASSRHKSETSPPRSTGDTSPGSLESVVESVEEKKESRKSRLLRRMSSLSSASRKSIVQAFSPTSKPEDPIAESEVIPELVPTVVEIGDLNVQFPDTLLWKRRHMTIDDQGYLILSPSKADDNSRSTTKRYHLSEFRLPYVPDHDRQELPNSVILDFCDGTTLQCACENTSGQAHILRTLKDAHGAYHRLYGQ